MDGRDGPKRLYAELILKLRLGAPIYDGEIDLLPDPGLFRDAVLLAEMGRWSPADLDATDSLLLALIERIRARK